MKVETVHRITGPHLLLPTTGAAVWFESDGSDWALYEERFKRRLTSAVKDLPIGTDYIQHHFDGGFAIAVKAPPDLLYTACAVLEWVTSDESEEGELWEAITSERRDEERPLLRELHAWASDNGLHSFDDEDGMSIGLGKHGLSW